MSNISELDPTKGKADPTMAVETKPAAERLPASQAAAVRAVDATVARGETEEMKTEPKLRHEFVGMMFALAIGEVGVQTAVLVRSKNWVHFLPAYSHLLLATVVIAASWVGWTLSPAPGARRDVRSIFKRDFLVLLVDVFLVVVYFILVKTVDFTGEKDIQLDASARPETLWILVIFGTYCVWDVLTKVLDYLEMRRLRRGRKPRKVDAPQADAPRDDSLSFKEWFKRYGIRMFPTIICFVALIFTKPLFDRADAPHVLTADLALLSLVLLFRALKGLTQLVTEPNLPKKGLIFWTALCLLGFGLGAKWTCSWPIPRSIADQIQTPQPEQSSRPEPAGNSPTSTQDSQLPKPDQNKSPK